MWRSLEIDALSIGLSYEYFWTINPNIYKLYRDAHFEKQKAQMRQHDLLNFYLGRYVAFGVNDPQKYPSQPFLAVDRQMAEMTDEEMETQGRRNTIRMGGHIES